MNHGMELSIEEFESYLRANPGIQITISDVIEFFDLPNTGSSRKMVANRVISTKKRQERTPAAVGGRIETLWRGTYRFTPMYPTIEPKVEFTSDPTPPMRRGPEPQRLYEWIADTSDGRTIVKDDQGKVWFATFLEL